MPRLSRNAPVVVVEQPPEEVKLTFLIQDVDLHQITELAHKCLHLAVRAARGRARSATRSSVFMPLLENCALSSWTRSDRVVDIAVRKRGAHAGLRSGSFEQDAVKDFDLVEMVRVLCEELPAAVLAGLHNRVIVIGKGNFRPI